MCRKTSRGKEARHAIRFRRQGFQLKSCRLLLPYSMVIRIPRFPIGHEDVDGDMRDDLWGKGTASPPLATAIRGWQGMLQEGAQGIHRPYLEEGTPPQVGLNDECSELEEAVFGKVRGAGSCTAKRPSGERRQVILMRQEGIFVRSARTSSSGR